MLHRDVCTGQKLEAKGRRSASAPDRGQSATDHTQQFGFAGYAIGQQQLQSPCREITAI